MRVCGGSLFVEKGESQLGLVASNCPVVSPWKHWTEVG